MEQEFQHLLALAIALLATGIFAGLLAGLLGVGGGIVMVPVLFYVFGAIETIDPAVQMHLAVGTSLAAMIPTSLRSALAHHRRGTVDMALLKLWIPGILLGILAGTLTAAHVKGPVLMGVFAFFALLIALHMMAAPQHWRLAQELPGRRAQQALAGGISAVSVMMGIGGGTFSVPALSLFGYPIHRAVGTAAAIGVMIAVPGAIGFMISGLGVPGRPPGSLGYASLIGVAMIVPATIISAPWGVALAHRFSQIRLRRAFALFLGITGFRMAISLL